MKVLLMSVPYTTEERYGKTIKKLVGPSLLPPLGLAYIAAVIRKMEDVDVRILDTAIENMDMTDIKEFLEKNRFDLIGISMMTPMYGKFLKLIKQIKPITKETPILVGGPHASILPVETLKENPEVDYTVFGEGEAIMPDLILHLQGKKKIEDVEGIAYRQGNDIKLNKPKKLIENLDTLPFPALDLLPIKKYIPAPSTYRRLPTLHMIASRGCPFYCTYCSAQSIFGRVHRAYSPKRMMDELEWIIDKYGAKDIFFLDDLFTKDKEWVHAVCDEILKRGIHKKICWSCSTRVSMVDYEMLKKMKKAGCWQIHFGVESGSQRLLNLIKKGITLEQSKNAMKICRKAGIQTRAYFMLGLPTETREESLQTIRFAKDIDPDYVKYSLTTPYPGTELFDIIKKEGNLKTESWELYKTMGGLGEDSERPYTPKGRTSKELNELQKRAHKEFFLRPKIILRFLFNIRSFDELKVYAKGALALLNI